MKLKHIIVIVFCILVFTNCKTYGQTKKTIFLGIQPISITIESNYGDGEFDANIFPIVFEAALTRRVNFRLIPTVNYHFGGKSNGFSDLGVYITLPIYFHKSLPKEVQSHGFYIGPVLGVGRNIINDHYTTTIAIEPGYMFKAKKRFTITLGCQFGGSYFAYDSKPNNWVTHFGPKFTLGFWLNKND